MSKDQLFLLAPGFVDPAVGPGTFYCRACAQVEGYLQAFPVVHAALEVHRVSFARPRREIVSRLGEEHQSCPVLVLGDDAVPPPAVAERVREANGHRFLRGADDITTYLGSRHGAALPH